MATAGPQLPELWFLAEDDVIQVSLNTARAKVKNLQRNQGFSLLVLDLLNPFRYLELRGGRRARARPGRFSGRRMTDGFLFHPCRHRPEGEGPDDC